MTKLIGASKRPVLFVSGPLSPIECIGCTEKLNIKIANDVAIQLFEATDGQVDILIPHNFHTPIADDVKCVDYDYYVSLDLGMMHAYITSGRDFCLYLMRDWKMSRGAKIECEYVEAMIAHLIHLSQETIYRGCDTLKYDGLPIIAIANDPFEVKAWLQKIQERDNVER